MIGDVEIASNGHLYASILSKSEPDLRWGDAVVEFDPIASKEIRAINVTVNPGEMVMAEEGPLYVSTTWDKIAVIDTQAGVIADEIVIELPCEPNKMILWPEDILYISACWSLSQINTVTKSVYNVPMQFRAGISDMAIGSGNHLFLLLGDEIQILDPVNWKTIGRYYTGRCRGVHIAVEGEKAYVACHDGSMILAYNVSMDTASLISLPDSYPQIATLSKGKVYLVQENGEKVLVLDTENDEIVAEISLP